MASFCFLFFGFVVAFAPDFVEKVENRSFVTGWNMIPMLTLKRLMPSAESGRYWLEPCYRMLEV
ncbi:MAG: hypothetical protein Q8O19_06795, partial [Rectinemataceae bacterium]|nr:hypothetical protein [Rectinemataceae bacterium]